MTPPAVTPQTAAQTGVDPPPARQFTFEEYCTYEDGTDNRYELVQGYLQLMSPPAGLHITICDFLVYVFNRLFARTQQPFQASREIGVRTQKNTCRIVDVCVNRKDPWRQISQPGEIGVFQLPQIPLLVVEAASTNEKEDYEAKYQEYASIGIPEYWIVNSRREHIRVCNSASPGSSYTDREFVKGEQIVSKVLPGLELTVDEVLNPPLVSDLIDLDQTERDALAAQNAKIAAERDVLAAEKAEIQQQLEQLKALIAEKGLDPTM